MCQPVNYMQKHVLQFNCMLWSGPSVVPCMTHHFFFQEQHLIWLKPKMIRKKVKKKKKIYFCPVLVEDIPRHLLCIHNSLHLSMSLNAKSGDRKWPWTPHPVSVGALLSCLWTNTFLYTFRIDAYSRVVCLCVCVNYGGAHTREVDRRVNWIVGKMQIRACLFERGGALRRGLSDWRLSLWRLHTQTQQDHFDHILQREWWIVFVYAFFSTPCPFPIIMSNLCQASATIPMPSALMYSFPRH